MAKVGRKSVMTEEAIRKIETVAAYDGTIAEMAFYADIHPDTLYAYMAANKEFSDRIKALRNKPVLKARQAVVSALDNHEFALKYLERKVKGEFSQRVEQTGAEGTPLFNDNAEELAKLASQLNELRKKR